MYIKRDDQMRYSLRNVKGEENQQYFNLCNVQQEKISYTTTCRILKGKKVRNTITSGMFI